LLKRLVRVRHPPAVRLRGLRKLEAAQSRLERFTAIVVTGLERDTSYDRCMVVSDPFAELPVRTRPIARISVAGVRAHPGRFASLTFAVFIGVLFVAATLTITDTVKAGFGSLFSNAYRSVSVVVREQSNVVRQNQTFRGRIDAKLATTATSATGVAAAQPRISGYAYVVSAQGKAPENVTSDTAGSPIAENWIDDAALNPYTLVEGTKPVNPGDVVIDRGTANSSVIAVGDSVSVISKDGASPGQGRELCGLVL
jgi:ABC-type lipoprotein release transport system permease subunit